jgi:tetratricopeptide (TPR) repeat protein
LLRLAIRERRWCDALEHALRLRSQDPDALDVARMLVRVQERLGFAGAAIETQKTIVAASPEDWAAALSLAAAFQRKGACEQALEAIELAMARGAPRCRALLLQGRAHRRMGHAERARQDFHEAEAALHAGGASPADPTTAIAIARELARPDELRTALATAVRGRQSPWQTARWLCDLASLRLLDEEEQAIGRALEAREAVGDTLWFLPLHAELGTGRARRVAAALRALPGRRREDPAWCSLLRMADPHHFVELDTPAPRGPVGTAPAGFAAVCCHFNPMHWRSRREATGRFREHVRARGVELLTVELAFGEDAFELPPGDDVLQLRAVDVMWHKERLLNLGIEVLLERGREAIAWLDADVVFEEPDWTERIVRTLERHRVCQAFDRVYRRRHRCDPGRYEPGSVFNLCNQRDQPGASGFAWAARAELLSEVRLYDAAVFGGGDRLIQLACNPAPGETREHAYPLAPELVRSQPAALLDHYRRWADRWGRRVAGDVGFADQSIQTFFHGDFFDRYGAHRQRSEFPLDPDRDLLLDASGAWCFAPGAVALRDAAIPWLQARREDEPHALAQEARGSDE